MTSGCTALAMTMTLVAAAVAVATAASPAAAKQAEVTAASAVTAGRWVDVPFPVGTEVASMVAATWATGQESWHVGTRLVRDGEAADRRTANLVVRCVADRCAQLNPPDVGQGQWSSNQLLTVSGTSPRDVWVGGVAGSYYGDRVPVLYHWDGRSWRRQIVEALLPAAVYDVSAKAPGDLAVLLRTFRPVTVPASIPMRLHQGLWSRLPLRVDGCDQSWDGSYLGRRIDAIDATGVRPVAIGVCDDRDGVAAGFAAARQGSTWMPLEPVSADAQRSYRAVVATGAHAWFAAGGRTMLRLDGDHTSRWQLPDGADDVDDLAANGTAVWAVGRASGTTAVWRFSTEAATARWLTVPVPDRGFDGRRLIAVLGDARPVVVDTGGQFPTLRRLDATSATPAAKPSTSVSAAPNAAPSRIGAWATHRLPVRVEPGTLESSWATTGESWHVGYREALALGAMVQRPYVVRCRSDGCQTMNPPGGGRVGQVSGTAPNDVWVTGSLGTAHWDGRGWTFADGRFTPGNGWLLSVSPAGAPWVIDTYQDFPYLVWNGTRWDRQPRPAIPCTSITVEYSTLDATGPYPVATGYCDVHHATSFVVVYKDGRWRMQASLACPEPVGAKWFAGRLYIWTEQTSAWNVLQHGRLSPVPAPPTSEGSDVIVTSSATRLWAVETWPMTRAWVRTAADSAWHQVPVPATGQIKDAAAADSGLAVLANTTWDNLSSIQVVLDYTG